MRAKNKKEEPKKPIHNMTLISVAIAILAVLVLAAYFSGLYPNQQSQPKAAIIDQLSSSTLTSHSRYVNQTFIDVAKGLLYTHFSEVDYYSENATVDNYENLPASGYKLIIWRAHSALDLESKLIAISTSETYASFSGDHDEFANGRLTLCNITDDPRLYVAITPKFIAEAMNGEFHDTVIILMNCNGLREGYAKTAEAFEEKGAKAFISWDGWIENPNNDQAATLLLKYLISENNTIQQAVDKIPQQQSMLGPSKLRFFPTSNETADYRIPSYNEKTATSNAWLGAMLSLRQTEAERSNCAHYELVDSAKALGVSTALKRSRITDYEAAPP